MLRQVSLCWSLRPARLTEAVQEQPLMVCAKSRTPAHEKGKLVQQHGDIQSLFLVVDLQELLVSGRSHLLHARSDVEREPARQSGRDCLLAKITVFFFTSAPIDLILCVNVKASL